MDGLAKVAKLDKDNTEQMVRNWVQLTHNVPTNETENSTTLNLKAKATTFSKSMLSLPSLVWRTPPSKKVPPL